MDRTECKHIVVTRQILVPVQEWPKVAMFCGDIIVLRSPSEPPERLRLGETQWEKIDFATAV